MLRRFIKVINNTVGRKRDITVTTTIRNNLIIPRTISNTIGENRKSFRTLSCQSRNGNYCNGKSYKKRSKKQVSISKYVIHPGGEVRVYRESTHRWNGTYEVRTVSKNHISKRWYQSRTIPCSNSISNAKKID